MNFNDILNQVFQPYFYYSVLFLVVSFVCVKALTHFCPFLNPKLKSLLYMVPLAIPLAVMVVYVPQVTIQTTVQTIHAQINSGSAMSLASGPVIGSPASGLTSFLVVLSPTTVISATGLVCVAGLFIADIFVIVMLIAGDRLARRSLRVISLAKDDYQSLQRNVANLSNKMSIVKPNIGLVEDLRPNAFTIGYGKRATIVFSIGLLNILNEEEVTAVAAHELAHLKNRDFFYKLLTSTLTVVSFFNPMAYFTSLAAQREREMLADQAAVKAIEKPSVLSTALAKICKTMATMPRQSLMVNMSSNLLVTSSVLHRFGFFSAHPRLDRRLRSISAPNTDCHLSPRKLSAAVLLSVLVMSVACMVVYGMANLQTSFSNQMQPAFSGSVSDGEPVTGSLCSPSLTSIIGTGAVGISDQPDLVGNGIFVVGLDTGLSSVPTLVPSSGVIFGSED
ncbi:MAG: hypothetical protein CW716_02915 [Candidatus Bathyarchaeum sp.]|nr:MAG: hypothetical protein CW716_02915 [Candidatus Bathyarchaeum sp.]